MTRTEHDIAPEMWAIRLHEAGGPEALVLERIQTPRPGADEALVRVHAAAITPDELGWPVDRLPATPSYELSGEVAAIAPDVDTVAVGDPVWALTTSIATAPQPSTSSSGPRSSHPSRRRSAMRRAPPSPCPR